MRKYISLLIVFVLAIGFISANALAADFEITGNMVKDIEFGKSATFNLSVKSNLPGVTGVIALVDGDNLGWVGVDKYFFFLPYLEYYELYETLGR